MRTRLFLAVIFMGACLGSEARADWFWCKFLPCLDTKGEICAKDTKVEIKVSGPQSIWISRYEAQITNTWRGRSDAACPPAETHTVHASWNRKTNLAEEEGKTISCNKNPWTYQNRDEGAFTCTQPAGQEPWFPYTATMLREDQRNNLLYTEEPLRTPCASMSRNPKEWTVVPPNKWVNVKFFHHQYLQVDWTVLFWNQGVPPETVLSTSALFGRSSHYSPRPDEIHEGGVTATEAAFLLDRPGYYIVTTDMKLRTDLPYSYRWINFMNQAWNTSHAGELPQCVALFRVQGPN